MVNFKNRRNISGNINGLSLARLTLKIGRTTDTKADRATATGVSRAITNIKKTGMQACSTTTKMTRLTLQIEHSHNLFQIQVMHTLTLKTSGINLAKKVKDKRRKLASWRWQATQNNFRKHFKKRIEETLLLKERLKLTLHHRAAANAGIQVMTQHQSAPVLRLILTPASVLAHKSFKQLS